jgi:hypothetical protein
MMDAYSNYYIKSKDEPNKIVTFIDQNPTGVTLMLKDQNDDGGQLSFSLPRTEMIEALEYVLQKIKARDIS